MSKSLMESTAEAVAERTATAGEKIGRAVGWSFVATIVVHLLTTYREYTVLLALRALVRATTADGKVGFWAKLFSDAAHNYDSAWSWLLGLGS